jgi:hypothetical protein
VTERPLAVVVRKPGQSLDAFAIKAHLGRFAVEGAILEHAVPERIVFVDALPRTSVGKIDKKLLRARKSTNLREPFSPLARKPDFFFQETDMNLANIQDLVGQGTRVSEWETLDQQRIDQFAECTGDHQ